MGSGFINRGRLETMAAAGASSCSRKVRAESVSVALHDPHAGKTLAEQRAKIRIEFDEREAAGLDAAQEQRAGNDAGAGSEFDDRAGDKGIDGARHRLSQGRAGRHHGADQPRIVEPGPEKPHFIGETALCALPRCT